MQEQRNIPDDIEQTRYKTINPQREHVINHQSQPPNNQYGNSRPIFENNLQKSQERETREKHNNRREAIKLIPTFTINMNNFQERQTKIGENM